jgi:Domain of unknown function (DUF5047)
MLEMSDRLKRSLTGGGTVAVELEFFERGEESVSIQDRLIIDGTVSASSTVVSRSFNLTVLDRYGVLTPDDAADLFAPTGRYEVRIKRGMVFADGTTEMVPLIHGRIEEVEGRWPELAVSGYDRMYSIAQYEWTRPYSIARGTNVATAIAQIAVNRWQRQLPMDFVDTEEVLPLTAFEEGQNPADNLDQLATGAGLTLFFDPIGVLTLINTPDPATDPPVWRFVEGERGTALLSGLVRRTVTEGVTNGVIATGESTDNTVPVRGEWWDTNPASPTYLKTFGPRPRRYSSPLLKTNAQAAKAARTVGLNNLGLVDGITFPGLVIPGLEPWDVVYVERPAQNVADTHVLDQLTFQLRAQGSMNTQTRQALVTELSG